MGYQEETHVNPDPDPIIRAAVTTLIEAIATDRVQHRMTLGEARIAAKLDIISVQFEDAIEVIRLMGLIDLEVVPSTPKGGRPTQRLLVAEPIEQFKAIRRKREQARQAKLEHVARSFAEALHSSTNRPPA